MKIIIKANIGYFLYKHKSKNVNTELVANVSGKCRWASSVNCNSRKLPYGYTHPHKSLIYYLESAF